MRKKRYLVVYDEEQYDGFMFDSGRNLFMWFYSKRALNDFYKTCRWAYKEYGVYTYVHRVVEFN